jgi:putative ABC transport system ATP-binding protein
MANPLIQITNIKRDFVLGNEIVYVLKGIDLQINKGEYVALMGPQVLKINFNEFIRMFRHTNSGSYILNGKDVSQMRDDELAEIRNKEIGFVFKPSTLPRTTALDNVALPMIYAGFQNRNETRATEVLEQVNLPIEWITNPTNFLRTTPACGYCACFVNKPLSFLPMSLLEI